MMNNKLRRRSSILFLVFIIISLIVAIALFKLQIISYDLYQEEVLNQLTVETRVNPERGTIYDRNGEILATNETVWVLYAMPKNIKNPDEIASEIAKILSTDYEKVYKKIVDKSYKYQREVLKILDKYRLSSPMDLAICSTLISFIYALSI